MHKPYDTTIKRILDLFGNDWFAWLAQRYGYPPGPVEQLNPEIDTVQIAADRVFRLPDNGGLVHLEVQSSWDGDLPDRMLEYNVYLHRRERTSVHSVAILLHRNANATSISNTLVRRRRTGELILQFEYDVIRVWELNAEEMLAGHLGLAPIALLADGARPRLSELIKTLAGRVENELQRVATQSDFLASTAVLLGLRYDYQLVMSLFEGVQAMKESSVYQAWFGEAEAKGEAKAYRLSLIALLEQKFGGIPAALEARIQATTDSDKLKSAIRQVLTITSADDLTL